MFEKLFYNTLTPTLRQILEKCMQAYELRQFRLVGGTALSLYRGHRFSVNIDLFTDALYGSIDFNSIDLFINNNFEFVKTSGIPVIANGKSYIVGNNEKDVVKLDVFYTDPFIDNHVEIDGIRFASIDDIIAMKAEVIAFGGRKKDFWDIHEFIDDYSFSRILELYSLRNPYGFDKESLIKKFIDFSRADNDFDPNDLKSRTWEVIKLEIYEFVKGSR